MNRLLKKVSSNIPAQPYQVAASVKPEQEVLVADARAGLTPRDMVERKLMRLLSGASVAGSHVRMFGLRVRGRAEE